MNNFTKKLGRRAAGTWGRPRKEYAKRMSAKAIRRLFKKDTEIFLIGFFCGFLAALVAAVLIAVS